jgi:hypothetical protein
VHKHTPQETDVTTDYSELKDYMYAIRQGSTNFHKILEPSKKHKCQKCDINEVTYPGPKRFLHSLHDLGPGYL